MPQVLIAALLLLAALPAAAEADAADYLEMYKQNANICLTLNRGKMVMLRNINPEHSINYRMARYLAGVRQGGLTVDSIEPGDEGQALGCERIDGLEQKWELLRATIDGSKGTQ